ncbi:MAG: hypothetical protein ACXW3D_04270 [Caulobacteraceae bacterium]
MISYGAVNNVTVIEGEVNGSGLPDLRIEIFFDMRAELSFVL